MVDASVDVAMSSSKASEDNMSIDEQFDVVIKPRTLYSNLALRKAVPHTDLKKKKESLSMSLINLRS